MGDIFDLDAMVEASWQAFEKEYGDAMRQLRAGEFIVATPAVAEGARRGVPMLLTFPGYDHVRLVVPGNEPRSPHRLSRSELYRLRQLGLRRGSARGAVYRALVPLDRCDAAAGVATAVLRSVFGVRHPAFLEGGGFTVRGGTETGGERPGSASSGVFPEGPDDLDRLIVEALTPVGDMPPTPDDDGFLRVTSGPVAAFVRSFACSPTIYVYAPLVHSIADHRSARRLVESLGRQHPELGFQVVDDSVIVNLELDAVPFDAGLLESLVEHLLAFALQRGPGLAARLGGIAFSG